MQTVLSREGNNATSVTGHNMQSSANQMSSTCLLREACSRRSDFGNGAKRCEQGAATRSLTYLKGTGCFNVAVTWPESRNASSPHAIRNFDPSSWRQENQGP